MNDLAKIRLIKAILWIFLLWGLAGCARTPTRFVPPRTPLPNTEFTVTRNVTATWHALLRALEADTRITVATTNTKQRKVIMESTSVDLLTYCDCGRMGQVPLSGMAQRKGTITLTPTAPQETVVRIRTDYWTTYKWKNAQGDVVRRETVPCVSNGRFERRLYRKIRGYLAP